MLIGTRVKVKDVVKEMPIEFKMACIACGCMPPAYYAGKEGIIIKEKKGGSYVEFEDEDKPIWFEDKWLELAVEPVDTVEDFWEHFKEWVLKRAFGDENYEFSTDEEDNSKDEADPRPEPMTAIVRCTSVDDLDEFSKDLGIQDVWTVGRLYFVNEGVVEDDWGVPCAGITRIEDITEQTGGVKFELYKL